MAGHADDSQTSSYTGCPKPTQRYDITTCFSLHLYSASSCPYNCSECRELEAFDTQILMDDHNLLVNFLKRRCELKENINRHHDKLTSTIPIEIVSHVFAFVVDGSDDHRFNLRIDRDDAWNPVIMLGAVCRRWRTITLGTPQLWTQVTLILSRHVSFPNIAERWLSRSCTLPLSLKIDGTNLDERTLAQPSPTLAYSSIAQLISLHTSHLKDVEFRVPTLLLYGILTGLDNPVIVNLLSIEILYFNPVTMGTMNIKSPFVPKHLHLRSISMPHIPIQHWDRLTHLSAKYISADGLVHIFRHAYNLMYCYLNFVEDDASYYPMPTFPVLNVQTTEFDSRTDGPGLSTALRHLTLPTLRVFHYIIPAYDQQERMDVLANFLDRSQPPLVPFHLHYSDIGTVFGTDWYRMLPSITFLALDISQDNDGGRLGDYIKQLAAHIEPPTLPRLEELRIIIDKVSPDLWDGLAAIFPDTEYHNDTTTRPLRTVTIYLTINLDLTTPIIARTTYHRICAIRASGVVLEVFDDDMNDLLGHDVELIFCESKED